MHPSQIKAALEMRDMSQTAIARQCGGVSVKAVSLVVHGRSRSRRIENRIALVIDKPLAEIWPQWYGRNARSIRRRSHMTAAASALNL